MNNLNIIKLSNIFFSVLEKSWHTIVSAMLNDYENETSCLKICILST